MAEIVQYRLEAMIPELEDFEQKGVFSKDEISIIVKKRTRFEYLLKRRQPPIQDFLRYIEYELNLDLLRKKRKHRLGILGRATVSDRVIKERVEGLFEKALEKHRGSTELWDQYINFVKDEEKAEQDAEKQQQLGQLSQYIRVMKLYARVIQNLPHNVDFWIKAALFEFEVNNNDGNARRLMQRGLRLNKSSKKMWLEYCKFELVFAEKIKIRRKILKIDDNEEKRASENAPDVQETSIEVPALEEELSNTQLLELEDLEFQQALDEENEKVSKKSKKLKKSSSNGTAGEEPSNEDKLKTDHNPYLKGEVAVLIYKYAVSEIPQDLELRKQFLELFNQFGMKHVVEMIAASVFEDFSGENYSPEALFYAKTVIFNLFYQKDTPEWLEEFVKITSTITELIESRYKLLDLPTATVSSKPLQRNVLKSLEKVSGLAALYQSWLITTYKSIKSADVKMYVRELVSQTFLSFEKKSIISAGMVLELSKFQNKTLSDTDKSAKTIKKGLNYKYIVKGDNAVSQLYEFYLELLLKKYKTVVAKEAAIVLKEFEAYFNKSLNFFELKGANNMKLYTIWLDLSEYLSNQNAISAEEVHNRYKAAMLNSNISCNRGPALAHSTTTLKTEDNGNENEDETDPRTILQKRYIEYASSKYENAETASLLPARKAFEVVVKNSKPTLQTLEYVLTLETDAFETMVEDIGVSVVNKAVLASNTELEKTTKQIIKIFELGITEYPEETDVLDSYIEFLRRVSKFDEANNVLLKVAKV